MSSSSTQHWDNVYTTKPTDSVSWYQQVPAVSLRLIEQSAAPPAAVIDIGGGASHLVDHLVNAGYAAGVLDISAASLDIVRSRLGPRAANVQWFVQDITEFSSPRKWDVWHDRAVFHFLVDPAARDAYRAALEAGTSPGSYVIIATFGPEGPERCSGLPVRRYSPDEIQAELGDRFELLDVEWEMHDTPGGARQQFAYCRFRRTR